MLFLSDLDRTLIFSYKRLSEDNICVEEMDGKKLSYMTPHSAELLREIALLTEFIPVTTRSAEQYRRICLPSGTPHYAVCDNGGNLLIDNIPDPKWRKRAEELIRPAMEEMSRIRAYWETLEEIYLDVRFVDETFLYTKSHTPSETLKQTAESFSPETVNLFENGDKIYAVPKGISKGTAVRWLREMLGDKIIAAGDSLFDREMLDNADIAVIKLGELSGECLAPVSYNEETDDPDFTLDTVKRIITE